jgi:hypothetical protein
MGLQGKSWRREKVIMNDTATEQITSFNYLGCKISEKLKEDTESSIVKYNKVDDKQRTTQDD